MTVEIIRPASREEWLAARRSDVTASVAGCLFGVHPYITPYTLWAIKTGRITADEEDSPALRRGRLLEPVAIEMLREERPEWRIRYTADFAYYRDPAARLGATPDAFAVRYDVQGRGIVQVKTASDYAFRDWVDPDTKEVVLPLWIAVQAIVEADLSEATWACVALLVVGRGIDLHVIDVPLHDGVRRRVRAAVKEFWRIVDAGEHPPIDWNRDGPAVLEVYRESFGERRDLSDRADLDAVITRYLAATTAKQEAEHEVSTLKPQIIYALEAAEAGFTQNFDIIATTSSRGHRVLRVKPREHASVTAAF